MDIEQCIYYNKVTVWFLFIIQSINLPPSAPTITSSAHCNTLQTFATYSQASSIYPVHIKSSVHTAANCSHLQPPTLQLCYSVHTAAIMYDANTIQYIQ